MIKHATVVGKIGDNSQIVSGSDVQDWENGKEVSKQLSLPMDIDAEVTYIRNRIDWSGRPDYEQALAPIGNGDYVEIDTRLNRNIFAGR